MQELCSLQKNCVRKLNHMDVPSSGVTELQGALRKFSFGGPRHLLSINIYYKTLISVVFTESSEAL